jgi:hypothetical protein
MMGRMGSGLGFGGMMRGYGYSASYANTGTPLTITEAKTIGQNYVTSIGNPNLTVKQIEESTNNFYIQVNEESTGKGTFELLINKQTNRKHLPRNGTQHDVEHQVRDDAQRHLKRNLRKPRHNTASYRNSSNIRCKNIPQHLRNWSKLRVTSQPSTDITPLKSSMVELLTEC